ncbi:MAG: type VI secretion system contractile sheath small subunit [Deltaproteobacteria bacterium]|nr:type VI secretion system contractile sheath small subunit [Deltaproteobacteria bacterium]
MDNPSISPSRINIVYKTNADKNKTDKELPLKLLVLGNFTRSDEDNTLEERQTFNISSKNLDLIMKNLDINLKLIVKNRLANDSEEKIPLNLKITSISDFEPDNLLENMPELKKLADLCIALKTTQKTLAARPTLWKRLRTVLADEDAKADLLKTLQEARLKSGEPSA